MTVTLSHISLPLNIDSLVGFDKDSAICQLKLSSTSALSNQPIKIEFCKNSNFENGVINIGFWVGVNLPIGTNTGILNVKYGNIKWWRTTGGYYRLYRSLNETCGQGTPFESGGTIPTYIKE